MLTRSLLSSKAGALAVRVGADLESLVPLRVNDDAAPVWVEGPHWAGYITVRVAGSTGVHGASDTDYFKGKRRLFSFQTRGVFKSTNPHAADNLWTGDDVLFVAQFDRKIPTPPGTNVAVKCAKLIDGTFFADNLFDEKPFFGSFLVAGMNTIRISPALRSQGVIRHRDSALDLSLDVAQSSKLPLQVTPQPSTSDVKSVESGASTSPPLASPEVPSKTRVGDWRFGGAKVLEEDVSLALDGAPSESVANRRSYFCSQEGRKRFVFWPDMVYETDFFNNYLDLGTPSLKLGITIDCKRILKGIPITFAARSRSGEIFYVIEIRHDI